MRSSIVGPDKKRVYLISEKLDTAFDEEFDDAGSEAGCNPGDAD